MKIELKNLKVCKFASQETTCFEASIWVDDKKAGFARNEGSGGCTMIDFMDKQAEAKFDEFIKNHPPCPPEHGLPEMPMSAEIYIGELIEKAEARKWYARKCKKETLFRLRTDPSKAGCDEWRTIKNPYSPAVKKFLVEKYGEQLGEIANETRV